MAVLEGSSGQVVTAADSGGAETAVANVRSWTVTHEKAAIESTKMGDAARTYISGLHQFSGSMEVVYDDTATGLGIFDPSIDTTLRVIFRTTTTASKPQYEGDVVVTSVARTASFDDLVTATVDFQGTGPLIESTTA
jgi:hypothetical protein